MFNTTISSLWMDLETFNDPLLASYRTVTDTTERDKVVLFMSFLSLKKYFISKAVQIDVSL